METTKNKITVLELLIEAIGAAGVKGAAAQEAFAHVAKSRQVSAPDSVLLRAVEAGIIFKLGSGFESRYYATKDLMERGTMAWEKWRQERRAQIIANRKAVSKRTSERRSEERAKERANKPEKARKRVAVKLGGAVRAPWTVDTPAIILPTTRITIAPPLPDPKRTNTYARSW